MNDISHYLRGERFGYLTVDEIASEFQGAETLWKCSCFCGRTVTVRGIDLLNGHVTSCGCAEQKELEEEYARWVVSQVHERYNQMKPRRFYCGGRKII